MRKLLILLIPLLLVGCIHVRNNPKAPVPPLVKVATYNAILGETNHGIAQGMILANQAGLLSDAQTGELTEYNFEIAAGDKQLTTIIDSGMSGIKADPEHVKQLLASIKAAAVHIASSPSLGVKNPKSGVTFTQDAEAIASTIDLIVDLLQQEGVWK